MGVRCQSHEGWVSIDVHDSGIGIEREVSGYGQPTDVAQSRAAGFQVHLVKPIEPKRRFEAMELLMSDANAV